jgi:hypothetical protein
MSACAHKSNRRILAAILLVASTLVGTAMGFLMRPSKASTPPRPAKASSYSLVCSQTALGASHSEAGAYSVKDVLEFATPSRETQSSGNYAVTDIQLEDNPSSARVPAGVGVWRQY